MNQSGLKARRLPRAGAKDIGDVAVELRNGHVLVLELKNVKAVNMADFLRQAEVEAGNYAAKYDAVTYGLVAVKTRQKHIRETRITLTVETLLDFLRWNDLT